MQRKKPSTPQDPPDRILRRFLREKGKDDFEGDRRHNFRDSEDRNEENEDKNRDWSHSSLLSPDKRISTLIDYIAIELFTYPEIRRSLKEKYYRKLLISTNPTNKGAQNINIYNSFFPVKRIKDKPVSYLKK